MKLVRIDIGKNKHSFAIIDKDDGEILVKPDFFNNDKDGYESRLSYLSNYPEESVLIGMEDTGHYHFNLLKYLLHNIPLHWSTQLKLINLICLLFAIFYINQKVRKHTE